MTHIVQIVRCSDIPGLACSDCGKLAYARDRWYRVCKTLNGNVVIKSNATVRCHPCSLATYKADDVELLDVDGLPY